jgi:hypothetical protein
MPSQRNTILLTGATGYNLWMRGKLDRRQLPSS